MRRYKKLQKWWAKQKKKFHSPYDKVVKLFLPIVPKWVQPNHLTWIRLLFAPIVLVLLAAEYYFSALILFIVLALTDMLDGSLARLYRQETAWGRVWDPIADKLLIGYVICALLFKVNFTLAVLILIFEALFVVSGTVYKANHRLEKVQANFYGKVKMNLQCFGAGFLMLGMMLAVEPLLWLAQVLFYIALVFALFSLLKRGI